MDYQGIYDDLLLMQRKAVRAGHALFARECYEFRADLMDMYYRSIDPTYVLSSQMQNGEVSARQG